MSIIETLNGGVPYATGTKVEAVDINKLSTNDRANALAARTAWTLGVGKASGNTWVLHPWSSEVLKEFVQALADKCYAMRMTSSCVMVESATTGLASEHYAATGGTDRPIELIKMSDWTDAAYSTGLSTFTAFAPTATPGKVMGPAYWVGGASQIRLVPGVATGTGDGYPTVLVGSATGTWSEFSYPTTEQGPIYRTAGGYPSGTPWAIFVGETRMAYGNPLVSVTWSSLPSVTGVASGSLPGIAWDASRSLFVMTRYMADGSVVVATSPTGATWSNFRSTEIGISAALPSSSITYIADICVIDGAWFVLRPTNPQGMWGSIYTLICSLDAGASWVDMCLPAIEAQVDSGAPFPVVPQFGIMSHLGRLAVYTADTLAISSVIAVPAAVASEAI
jgi:hypothetical protein